MIKIKSPKILKTAQNESKQKSQKSAPMPWELTPEEMDDFEYIGEDPGASMLGQPAVEDDFKSFGEPSFDQVDPKDPGYEIKPLTDFSFLPQAPTPSSTPINPEQFVGEEVDIPTTDIEQANETLGIREKIFYSLNNSTPLHINYTTINSGSQTERTILPDYVYWAGTNRHILVAWDNTKSDWRAFSVDNINFADLIDQDQ